MSHLHDDDVWMFALLQIPIVVIMLVKPAEPGGEVSFKHIRVIVRFLLFPFSFFSLFPNA